jgi:hypothetical protein
MSEIDFTDGPPTLPGADLDIAADPALDLPGNDAEDAQLVAALLPMATPPASLAAYDFAYPHSEETPTSEQLAADREIRTWLAAGRFPANIGSALAQAVNAASERADSLVDDEAHELARRDGLVQLQRLWGDRMPEMMDHAEAVVAGLDKQFNGRVSQFLEAAGATIDVQTIVLLAQHGERLHALRGRRG